jgi:SAM-dependent methyltransferase
MFLSKFPDADVQGIEVSMEAYKAAPAALQRRILVGDIFELESELPRGLVDLVVCSEVLEHVRDPAAFLGVLRDLLKPGGSLLLTVPAGMAHWSVQDEVAGHLRRFEYEEFSDLLRQQGLVVERQYTWGGPVGTLYNRLISGIGPERAANAADTLLVQVLAWTMRLAMRLDDLFKSTKRFQLIARASRPIEQ